MAMSHLGAGIVILGLFFPLTNLEHRLMVANAWLGMSAVARLLCLDAVQSSTAHPATVVWTIFSNVNIFDVVMHKLQVLLS